jgi:hypothetical protein
MIAGTGNENARARKQLVCDHPRACVLTFGAIIERWPLGFASTRDTDKIQAYTSFVAVYF